MVTLSLIFLSQGYRIFRIQYFSYNKDFSAKKMVCGLGLTLFSFIEELNFYFQFKLDFYLCFIYSNQVVKVQNLNAIIEYSNVGTQSKSSLVYKMIRDYHNSKLASNYILVRDHLNLGLLIGINQWETILALHRSLFHLSMLSFLVTS